MKDINLQESIVKAVISAFISAFIVSLVTRYTLINTLSDQMIEIEMRVQNLEQRYVEVNQFQPIAAQTVENKNRINENVKQLQKHEVEINILSQ